MQFFAPRQIIPNRGCSASASCFALAAPQSLPSLLSLFLLLLHRFFFFVFFIFLLLFFFFVPRIQFSLVSGFVVSSSWFCAPSHLILLHYSLLSSPPQSIYESPRFTPNLIYSCRSSTVHQLLFVAPFLFDCLRLYFHNITFLSCFSCVHIYYHLSSLLFFLSLSLRLSTLYTTPAL